jgi:hypothetical protein
VVDSGWHPRAVRRLWVVVVVDGDDDEDDDETTGCCCCCGWVWEKIGVGKRVKKVKRKMRWWGGKDLKKVGLVEGGWCCIGRFDGSCGISTCECLDVDVDDGCSGDDDDDMLSFEDR